MKIKPILKSQSSYLRIPVRSEESPATSDDDITHQQQYSPWPLRSLLCLLVFVLALGWSYTIFIAQAYSERSPSKEEILISANSKFIFLPPPQPHNDIDGANPECSGIPVENRFDCFPGPNITQDSCESRGCCYVPTETQRVSEEPLNIPFCFYPPSYVSYEVANITKEPTGMTVLYKNIKKSPYPDDVQNVRMEVIFETEYRLRVRITDKDHPRYEVPYIPDTKPEANVAKAKYDVKVSQTKFGFQVVRDNGQILFDTLSIEGGFTFADQFLQVSTLLPSHYIYGLGENVSPFLKSTYWNEITLWNKDSPPYPGTTNLYGSHPFYLSIDENGNSFGVFLKNSNAMEVILQPTPAATFRSLGGIFDFYFFMGPDPISVIQQYTEVVGRPFLPPFWSLGYHQCRYGYNSAAETRRILDQTRAAGIPIDTQWNDIDYMENHNDFTVDPESFADLPDLVDYVHSLGMHYVVIVDPGVSAGEKPGTYPPFDEGLKMDIFVKNASGSPFIGKVWNPKSTAFPDWTNPNTEKYWANMIQDFRKKVPLDGLWIDMNEPSNFVNGQQNYGCPTKDSGLDGKLNYPPYLPRNLDGHMLAHRTMCPSARHHKGLHYDLHNLFGFTETIVTNSALRSSIPGKRPFIISRSTFPGQGHYGGHWTGDIWSDWTAMKMSISGILTSTLEGIPMVGADICGFNGNTTAKLCQRWMQLGAFYPFSRNHNTDDGVPQDPVSLGASVTSSSQKALTTRYTLLPLLYSLFVSAHLRGTPVARSMTFEFPRDIETRTLDGQFMWGRELLVVPVLQEDATTVEAYFPDSLWYNFYTAKSFHSGGSFMTVDAPLDTIPLFVRGGSILPKKPPANTTTEIRTMPFHLIAYLDSLGSAEGELYWDDGESIDSYTSGEFTHVTFKATGGSALTSSVERAGYSGAGDIIDYVGVFGVENSVKTVTVNGMDTKFYVSEEKRMLGIPNLSLDLNKPFKIKWT